MPRLRAALTSGPASPLAKPIPNRRYRKYTVVVIVPIASPCVSLNGPANGRPTQP